MPGLWITPEEMGELSTSPFALDAAKSASWLLWALSGRKYHGVRTTTERYAYENRTAAGRIFYTAESVDRDRLLASSPIDVSDSRIRLRGQPVRKIISVRDFTDAEIDSANYYLADHRFLGLKGSLPSELTVTYEFGALPPIMGQMAARKLAMEFVLLWEGSRDCALPDRVSAITREGVSYTILDNQSFLKELRTGVYEIDMFIKSVNPSGASRPARVISPETRRARKIQGGPAAPSNGWTIVPSGGN